MHIFLRLTLVLVIIFVGPSVRGILVLTRLVARLSHLPVGVLQLRGDLKPPLLAEQTVASQP